MKWQDQSAAEHAFDESLVSLVANLGVDRAYAEDVVGAVYSFCLSRHGTRLVSSDYLAFLLARSACGTQGTELSTDIIKHVEIPLTRHQHMHLRALMHADDPAALYESFRRGLLGVVTTSLNAEGVALQLNMDRIKALPQDDLSLVWQPVLRKIAGWLVQWRMGNPELRLIIIKGTDCAFTERNNHRQLLTGLIRQRETGQGIVPATIVWVK